jgi:phosphatidylethanolamine/phosphatidyl-N-methylethanolamine N-methyltransferase
MFYFGLNFEELFLKNNKQLMLEGDNPVMMNGMYRKIVLSKKKLGSKNP